MIIRHNAILKQLAEQLPFDPTLPWEELDSDTREQIIHGTGNRQFSFKLKGGNAKPVSMTFEGVLADLESIRRNTTSDGLRALTAGEDGRLRMWRVEADEGTAGRL